MSAARAALLLLALACCAQAPVAPRAPAPSAPRPRAQSAAGLVYRADFNHQRCSSAEIDCGARHDGDPCTVEGERCLKACGAPTEVLICVPVDRE
jgi:hypothetical protein